MLAGHVGWSGLVELRNLAASDEENKSNRYCGAATHMQKILTIDVHTSGQRLYEITPEVRYWVAARDVDQALLTIFIPHTSASVVIQENADPTAAEDLKRFFARLVAEDETYLHAAEGPDDMPAHIRAALTATSLSIPVDAGEPALGTWQGIFLFEHRRAPQRRRVKCALSPLV